MSAPTCSWSGSHPASPNQRCRLFFTGLCTSALAKMGAGLPERKFSAYLAKTKNATCMPIVAQVRSPACPSRFTPAVRGGGGGASERAWEVGPGGELWPNIQKNGKRRGRASWEYLGGTCGVVPRCLSLARSGHCQQRKVAADKEQGALLEARCRAVGFEPPKSSNRPKGGALLPHHTVLQWSNLLW